ncbi:MAG: hypothetical protein IT371_30030 [Deltaproteobacteria bacterium]|nr:hypothetical protein [Deltaproteobacteria bacterium]
MRSLPPRVLLLALCSLVAQGCTSSVPAPSDGGAIDALHDAGRPDGASDGAAPLRDGTTDHRLAFDGRLPPDGPRPTSPCSTPPAPLLSEDFEGTLAAWTVAPHAPPVNEPVLRAGCGYRSNRCLALVFGDGSNAQHVMISRSLPGSTDLLVRVYFYDDMDPTLGSMIEVSNAAGTGGLGLGVVTSLYPSSYAIRFNTFAGTKDTKVPRSAGWHLFELIVTGQGSYGKVDNVLFREVNPSLTSASKVSFVATWNLTGQAIYDQLAVHPIDRRPWPARLCSELGAFYDTYGKTDFSPLYPTLGTALHSNDLRSLFDTAGAFAIYGQRASDATARARGKQLFLDGLAHGQWGKINDWARGVALSSVARAAHLLWAELDAATRAKVQQLMFDNAQLYLARLPESGHVGDSKAEENAWHADFLAAVLVYFPGVPNAAALEAKLRCFAYHSITRSTDAAYCGLKTQTVYDTFLLENHNKTSPIYAASTIHLLAKPYFTFRAAGRATIPAELSHNVAPLYQKLATFVDPNTFHFVNAPADWSGATNSFCNNPLVLAYAEALKAPPALALQDLFSKRSLFYRDLPSEWVKAPPARLASFNQLDPTSDGYRWFLDANAAGGVFATAMDLLVP